MTNADHDWYHELHRRGLTSSRRHFSREWLRYADNYACARSSRGLPAQALARLCNRLWEAHHYLLAVRVAWSLIRAEGGIQGEPGR